MHEALDLQVRTEQRWLDANHTMPLKGHLNVFADGVFVGTIQKMPRSTKWLWGDPHHHEACACVEAAALYVVARYMETHGGKLHEFDASGPIVSGLPAAR